MLGERNHALDGIRGVAALGVFAFHAWLYTLPTVISTMPSNLGAIVLHELRVGWVLFFVLSGFVLFRPWIAASLDGRAPPNLSTYAIRRAARVLPAYYAALVGSVILLWHLSGTPGLRLPALDQLPFFAVFAQNYSPGTVMKLDPPMWTIAIEVSFYAVLPLLGWLACRRPGRARLMVVPVGLIAVGIAWNIAGTALGLGLIWGKTLPAVAAYFGVGMLAAVWLHGGQLRLGSLLAGAGAGLVLANAAAHALAGIGGPVLLPAFAGDLLAALGFGALITSAAAGARGTRWLAGRGPVAMGTVSYGFYLWHVPVLLWLRANELLPLTALGAIAVGLPISLALAKASWDWLERPAIGLARRVGRDFGDPVPAPAAAVA